MGEFQIIEQYFKQLTMGQAGPDGLRDDAAVLDIPSEHELVVSSDTCNEGVHFIAGSAPEDIARKALRSNLSDLAAMAATPLCYQLNLAFPSPPRDEWLRRFTTALMADNKHFDVFCSGGDTTSINGGGLSISITALGTVPIGKAVRRSGAKDGDVLAVTGALGAAVLGLAVLQGGHDEADYAAAVQRYCMPEPRLKCVDFMRQYAHAAADVSDGVLADSGHIASASGLGLEMDVNAIPFSDDVRRGVDAGVISMEQAVKGGDDYELVMAVAPDDVDALTQELDKIGVELSVVGRFVSTHKDMRLVPKPDFEIDLSAAGWAHF